MLLFKTLPVLLFVALCGSLHAQELRVQVLVTGPDSQPIRQAQVGLGQFSLVVDNIGQSRQSITAGQYELSSQPCFRHKSIAGIMR
jgi:hypothetical protein